MAMELESEFERKAGSIGDLLPIAIPMIFSNLFDTFMTFIDRVFLARVGIPHQSAAMIGGTTSWMTVTFFFGLIAFSTPLIAQYFGAGRKRECVSVVWQALRLAVVSYPLVLMLSYFASKTFGIAGHGAEQTVLEGRYFWYMSFGAILSLSRGGLVGFFTGIGETWVVLVGNVVGLVVNLVANYVLIFGKCGFPALGLDGAAIGTLLSSLSMLMVLAVYFLRMSRREEFRSEEGTAYSREKMGKLLRYGAPNGLENVLSMGAFVLLTQSFHAYGETIAASVTIVFNWDSMSFFPLVGLQIAVSSLVGRYMGRRRPDLASRAARSGFILSFAYSLGATLLFCLIPGILVGVFTPDVNGLDYTEVRAYAIPMLRMAGIYLMADGVLLVSSGVLRGAGDTFMVMVLDTVWHFMLGGAIFCCVHVFSLTPLVSWGWHVGIGILGGLMMWLRVRWGRWKELDVLKS